MPTVLLSNGNPNCQRYVLSTQEERACGFRYVSAQDTIVSCTQVVKCFYYRCTNCKYAYFGNQHCSWGHTPPLEEDPEAFELWPEGEYTFKTSEVEAKESMSGGATLRGRAAGLRLSVDGTCTRSTGRNRME
ncbi:uncharacterized protein BO80DRAFT_466698 [Aspergillus ibericus CBS 121593]|uniref:Uncharacterized protein n=1 Tax=Aspergillus ibericus CBS 121593 TaxID=1448316 RepID=A0A395GTF9_9EURO|nr:hypothetical protein BO80DRAFT_466698 [Aspergillus ibericus CBS 121593]RAK98729.1 hypothetical protein BO80DRAFT_466698 [Aspergillus ibericus CBS 121593]